MNQTHLLDGVGTTLLEVNRDSEYRRLFVRTIRDECEVGEVTSGSLTRELFDAPAQYHRVGLDGAACRATREGLGQVLDVRESLGLEELLARYFADEGRFLVDLMDDLDALQVPYAYASGVAGGKISYRPRGRAAARRPLLRLV